MDIGSTPNDRAATSNEGRKYFPPPGAVSGLYRFHSYLNRFESLESLEFSLFFCGALDRNMIRFAI
jgi:hypothetical protein